MIRIFTCLTFLCFSFTGSAQTCTPDGSFAGGPPGIYPETPLLPDCDLISAKTTVSLTDTLVQGVPIVGDVLLYFDAMKVNSIDGLPAGLTFETDVMGTGGPYGTWFNSGIIPNQTSAVGCAFIYGTGGDWDNLIGGGPNNDGVYPVTFHVDARIGQSSPDISIIIANGTWLSVVDTGLGGGEMLIEQEIHVLPGYDTINAVVNGNANPDPFVGENYSVGASGNVTYNWTVTNGTITGGQGTNQVTVEWDGSPTGNIQVELTDGGCYGISDLDVNVNPVGITDSNLSNLKVWPNPSSGVFEVSGAEKGSVIQVLTYDGRLLQETTNSSGSRYILDLTDTSDGIYLLRVFSETGLATKMLVKH